MPEAAARSASASRSSIQSAAPARMAEAPAVSSRDQVTGVQPAAPDRPISSRHSAGTPPIAQARRNCLIIGPDLLSPLVA